MISIRYVGPNLHWLEESLRPALEPLGVSLLAVEMPSLKHDLIILDETEQEGLEEFLAADHNVVVAVEPPRTAEKHWSYLKRGAVWTIPKWSDPEGLRIDVDKALRVAGLPGLWPTTEEESD